MVTTSEPTSFAEHLKRYRKEARLTQEGLAERAGLTARGIQNLERGVTRPYRDTTRRLVVALGLTSEDGARFEAAATPLPRRRMSVSSSPAAQSRPAMNLPMQLTRLIGRQHEIEQICRLLATERLVTLLGPPGVGKTRLALEVASTVAADQSNDVYFVPLAPVRDPTLVVSTIAQVLDVREISSTPLLECVQQALDDRHVLLVLDNFEQVLAATPFVLDLLVTCASLKLLVTSRAALQVYGEHEFVVSPLAVPYPDSLHSLERTAEFGAVGLFIERARALQADFALTETTSREVVAICRRLDGMPLAIELAASRIRILPPHELLVRLDNQLSLLTSGARDLPERHQTMRNAIDWSYNLLDAQEQTLLQRLSIFVGGATLEAIEGIGSWGLGDGDDASLNPHPQPPTPIFDVLQSLAGKRSSGERRATTSHGFSCSSRSVNMRTNDWWHVASATQSPSSTRVSF